jgi:hypothetical protein
LVASYQQLEGRLVACPASGHERRVFGILR